ncbi:aminodeoxychorismate synthase component I [Maritalea porphyrae]|uniref:Aminodeoxychorismate synthase, component I n=1 Tax=Maritalea porphyrae TaxID=880732 RepID=A0ABQ5UUS7_9HYPH|nr:aminodeoxychorismate synthase component I [Maritalea porphyrae]GLQ19035.1 aminodeoxychorismate synthase, component I [Maritalea porphyrae]
MQVKFDRGPDGTPSCFADPIQIIEAYDLHDVPDALAALDAACSSAKWLAGYASYELGYALEGCLHSRLPENRRLPLLRFGVYDDHHKYDPGKGTAPLLSAAPRWGADAYQSAFDVVYNYIVAGDIYQANLTFPIDARFEGDIDALYAALCAAQEVGYGAQIAQIGLPAILSRSPELFFATDTSGKISTRPMKGTQPRSDDANEDARRRLFLENDQKNRAENLMIVDLMRNDLSRICEIGSVKVPELFQVESFATVHQMTSLVQGQLRSGARLGDILKALFPCGSITGAPKIRAMEIISDLEPWPRDIYCGTIGWWAPDGRSEFNVAIRTLMVENNHVTLNVGGGVVYDSTATSEYEEALWKARFATKLLAT